MIRSDFTAIVQLVANKGLAKGFQLRWKSNFREFIKIRGNLRNSRRRTESIKRSYLGLGINPKAFAMNLSTKRFGSSIGMIQLESAPGTTA